MVGMRFVVPLCAAVLLLLVAVPAYSALAPGGTYGDEAYSPGEQHGGSYDCPGINRSWIVNNFVKSASLLGKSIFIDGNGNWIGAFEDSTTLTVLARSDLEYSYKKGSVKNTSGSTYSGYGRSWYEDTHWCV
jgi:hypothetical protein